MDEKVWKYYYRNRPPGYACQPEGFKTYEQWMPMRDVELPNKAKRPMLGYVEYAQPLSIVDMWKYELVAADLTQFCAYLLWYDADRDVDKALTDMSYYRKEGAEILEKVQYDHAVFWAALYFVQHPDIDLKVVLA